MAGVFAPTFARPVEPNSELGPHGKRHGRRDNGGRYVIKPRVHSMSSLRTLSAFFLNGQISVVNLWGPSNDSALS